MTSTAFEIHYKHCFGFLHNLRRPQQLDRALPAVHTHNVANVQQHGGEITDRRRAR